MGERERGRQRGVSRGGEGREGRGEVERRGIEERGGGEERGGRRGERREIFAITWDGEFSPLQSGELLSHSGVPRNYVWGGFNKFS